MAFDAIGVGSSPAGAAIKGLIMFKKKEEDVQTPVWETLIREEKKISDLTGEELIEAFNMNNLPSFIWTEVAYEVKRRIT